MADGIEQRIGEEDITVSKRMIALAPDGKRPTLVQYLAALPGYAVRGDKLLRPDRTVAAAYENVGTNGWVPYADPGEMVSYTAETSRSQRG